MIDLDYTVQVKCDTDAELADVKARLEGAGFTVQVLPNRMIRATTQQNRRKVSD